MFSFTLSSKTIPDLSAFHNTVRTFVPQFEGFLVDGDTVTVLLNEEATNTLINTIESITPPSMQQLGQVKEVIANARMFGRDVAIEFAAENVLMGITQDAMTGPVRKACSEVASALNSGSLKDAIIEIKAIPLEKRDAKYLTAARLTSFCNKIEDYLGIAHTTVT